MFQDNLEDTNSSSRSSTEYPHNPSNILKRKRSQSVDQSINASKIDSTFKLDLYNLVEDAHLHSMELNGIIEELREVRINSPFFP